VARGDPRLVVRNSVTRDNFFGLVFIHRPASLHGLCDHWARCGVPAHDGPMTRLASVLSTRDFPLAELCAARLDGELFPLDDCFTPIDEPDSALQRARSIGVKWPGRMIAERLTAAWIWGAVDLPPAKHELCVSLGARARASSRFRVTVREVVIDPDELITLGSVRVTNITRTLIDIARFAPEVDQQLATTMTRLAALGEVTLQHCNDALERRKNLPNKTIALERIMTLGLPTGQLTCARPSLR